MVGALARLGFFNAGNDGFAGCGQFIDAVGSVHNKGASRSESYERTANEEYAAWGKTPMTCERAPARVGERSAEIEDGAEAQGAAKRANYFIAG